MARQEIYRGGAAGAGLGSGSTRTNIAGSGGPVAQASEGAGISGLARAMEAGGSRILEVIAGEYKASERARIDEILLRTDEKFERWKTEYRETMRGADATDAQARFAEKYDELAREAMEEFGGNRNEIYRGELGRELRKRGLYALKDGGAYQSRELDAWNESIFRGQAANFERTCAENPEDGARIELEMGDALAAWRERNPGLDDTELRLKLAGTATRTRLDSLLAQGKFAEARGLLGGTRYADGGGGFIGGEAITRGMSEEVRETTRAAARKYGVDPELALAVAMQESSGNQDCVSSAGAIGVMQLMPKTARELGVDPRDMAQNIDGGVRYLAKMLNEFGGDVRDALTAYNMGPGGYRQYKAGKRGITRESSEYAGRVLSRIRDRSITPVERAHYEDKIASAEKKASQAALDQAFSSRLSEMGRLMDGDIDPEAKADRVYQYLEGVKDPETRLRLERAAREQLAYEDRAVRVREAREVGSLMRGLYDIVNNQSDPARRAADAYFYMEGVRDPARRVALEQAARPILSFAERADQIRAQGDLARRSQAMTKIMDEEPDPVARAAKIYDYLGSVSDPATRAALEREARERLAYDQRASEALDSQAARSFLARVQARDFSPMQALEWLNKQSDISPGAREIARKLIQGDATKTTFANQDALNQALVAIDSGELASSEERMVYAINNGLTPAQWSKLLEYQGNMEHVSIDQVRYAIQRYTNKDFKPAEVYAIYQQVAQEIPKGKRATTASIAQAVNSILMKGSLPNPDAWFGNTSSATYGEAMLQNRREEWLPDVSSSETPLLDQMLKERGHAVNPHNRKVMKKIWLQRPNSQPWLD